MPRAIRAINSGLSRLARIVLLVSIVLIPLRILGRGFLPPDDALRHAAKAVSGREWSEILVLRPGVALGGGARRARVGARLRGRTVRGVLARATAADAPARTTRAAGSGMPKWTSIGVRLSSEECGRQ
jgi:hypothetical protein